MSSLKVLTFGWELAPVLSGGLGVVCRDLTDALVSKDISVTFVVPKLPYTFLHTGFSLINASDVALDDATFNKLAIISTLDPYLTNANSSYCINQKFRYDPELYGVNLMHDVECYALTAASLAAKVEHDLIHAHDWMTGIAAIKAKQISGKPIVFHVHSTEYDRTANNPHPLILEYEKSALLAADKIIAISEYTKKIIIEKFKIDPQKISVIYNAINTKPEDYKTYRESRKSNEKMVLFLARLTIQKGADYLLKAAQKVIQKRKNVKFVIVGKGPMLSKLIDMSFELGIADKVIFAGSMAHNEVDRAYKEADLFVMPSVSEPFGLTCLEAIKNGTPVLISKQSGASEVIKNALKVDFWDTDDMASKILSVLEHSSLSDSLQDNGYYDLRKLTWSGQADKVIAIYQQVLSEQTNK